MDPAPRRDEPSGAEGRPLVSVILPFLDAGRFLHEAFESVLAQTYDRWELWLIDDGCTDGSSDAARAFAAQWPEKVHYLEHEGHRNLGVTSSRNVGLKHARGTYVALLDADDVWLPQKLEEQVRILEAHPEAAMVYGRSRYWYSWTGNPADVDRDYLAELGIEADTLIRAPKLLLLSYPLGTAPTPCPSDILLRRTLAERIGGFEESFQYPFQLYEDQAFLAKIYLEHAVFVSTKCWDLYRVHPESCVSRVTAAGQYHMVRQFFFDWFEKYLRVKDIRNDAVWRALRRVQQASEPSPLLEPPSPEPEASPSVGCVRFGDFRRLEPISRAWGFDRGRPIDRHYIEGFLVRHAGDIRGRVLEVGDDAYTRQFGGGRVTASDVLHVADDNPQATIVADLTRADHIPSDRFDCIILTQTLQFIYDTRAALRTLHRILRPGGVLLATFPGISHTVHDTWAETWCWCFTSRSARRLFEELFPAADVDVQAHGNVLAAISFLHGLAVEELRPEELAHRDPDYEMLITVRAMKPTT